MINVIHDSLLARCKLSRCSFSHRSYFPGSLYLSRSSDRILMEILMLLPWGSWQVVHSLQQLVFRCMMTSFSLKDSNVTWLRLPSRFLSFLIRSRLFCSCAPIFFSDVRRNSPTVLPFSPSVSVVYWRGVCRYSSPDKLRLVFYNPRLRMLGRSTLPRSTPGVRATKEYSKKHRKTSAPILTGCPRPNDRSPPGLEFAAGVMTFTEIVQYLPRVKGKIIQKIIMRKNSSQRNEDNYGLS